MSDEASKQQQLLVDVGNTRCKWSLRDTDGRCVVDGVFSGDLDDLPADVLLSLGDLNISRTQVQAVRVAIVRDDTQQKILNTAIHKAFDCSVFFAATAKQARGIRNSYADPSAMGVDRWCAILAAAELAGIPGDSGASDVCVVDAGSAVTVEWLRSDGVHLGGYITPGYAMQVRELLRGTGQVHASAKAPELDIGTGMEPGNSTQLAVHSGILASIVAHIEQSILRHREKFHGDVAVYLTGGDAANLSRFIRYPHRVVDSLVLDGLALAGE